MVATQPKFKVDFKELAVLAIQRQQRGAVVIILDDSTSDIDNAVYRGLGDVNPEDWTTANYKRLQLAFLGNPSKVIAIKEESSFADLQAKLNLQSNYTLCYPEAATADITANAVREAGGKTFIAHVYKCGIDNHIEFLDILRENNIIDGVECQNSAFKEENRETLEEYCKKYKLLMSGGSDCHGLKKPDRKIGVGYDNVCIEKDVLEGWNLKNILK
jgi:hypothetical protein